MNTKRKRKRRHDWHPADIKAALEKKGWNFSKIAREYGYAQTTPPGVLYKPAYHIQKIVGEILGIDPVEIWPSRYDQDGRPIDERPLRMKFRANKPSTTVHNY